MTTLISGTGNDKFPLQKGSKGTQVIKLQIFLNNEGAGLKTDGDFGKATLAALQKYYGKDSVIDQKDFDKLFLAQQQKKAKPVKVTYNNQTVEISSDTKEQFSNMLKTDYTTFVDLSTLLDALSGMGVRLKKHNDLVKQNGNKVVNGRYGDFASIADASAYIAKFNKAKDAYEKAKAGYSKRQTAYANSTTLKAAKLIAKAQGALVEKAHSVFNKLKSWTGVSGLGLEPITTALLFVAGTTVAVAAIVVMKNFLLEYLHPTIADAGMVADAIKDTREAAKQERADGKELQAKADAERQKGNTALAEKYEDMAEAKLESATQLEQKAADQFSAQQRADNEQRASESGSFLDNITKNAGKLLGIAVAGVALGLAYQNKDKLFSKAA